MILNTIMMVAKGINDTWHCDEGDQGYLKDA
jgi:hypothetical protein